MNLKTIYGAEFGKINSNLGLRMTASGLGVKGSNGQITVYDKATGTLTTVPDELTIGDIPMYAFPADKLEKGDLIIHAGVIKVVKEPDAEGCIAVNIRDQVEEIILIPRTFFGFKGISKVFSPFQGAIGGADGTFNPMMLMLMDGDGFGGDDNGLMMAMMMGGMNGGANGFGDMSKNPMLMAMLFSKML